MANRVKESQTDAGDEIAGFVFHTLMVLKNSGFTNDEEKEELQLFYIYIYIYTVFSQMSIRALITLLKFRAVLNILMEQYLTMSQRPHKTPSFC